jgi:hypothetical protein
MNQANVLDVVRRIESLLIEDEVSYPDAFASAIYVAAVSANQMGMSKETFLTNCGIIYDHDKREQMKEMQ